MAYARRSFRKRQGQSVSHPAPEAIEALESRTLLSWPNAPFAESDWRDTVYVNQWGNASLSGNLQTPGQFDGYMAFFDDPGTMTVQASCATKTLLAMYPAQGQPTQISAGDASGADPQVSTNIQSKIPAYFGGTGGQSG